MSARRLHVCLALSTGVLVFGTPSATLGLANRVFVSARSGNNANACDNINTPCQTFAGAVAQVAAGGEVIVLDSGGYGPVTIAKSLTIEAPPGVTAFIHPPSGNAIDISAGSGDSVVLKGLVLNDGPVFGIVINSVGALHIESCSVSRVVQYGIWSRAPDSEVFITDTMIRQNASGAVFNAGRASMDHCRFQGNTGSGVAVDGADVTVRDSVSTGNAIGFEADQSGGPNTVLNVHGCLAANNSQAGFGASAVGGGFTIARLSSSAVSENVGQGLINYGGATFLSLGNNFVEGNVGGDMVGSINVIPLR
jgi:hypothetical protein